MLGGVQTVDGMAAARQWAWTSACVPRPSPAPRDRAPGWISPGVVEGSGQATPRGWGPLARQKAAVNDQFCPGDKRRFVGRQKQHAVGDLHRLPYAAQRR